jgi:hypothetical protein
MRLIVHIFCPPFARFTCKCTIFQARPAGFEPATGGLEVRCSVP